MILVRAIGAATRSVVLTVGDLGPPTKTGKTGKRVGKDRGSKIWLMEDGPFCSPCYIFSYEMLKNLLGQWLNFKLLGITYLVGKRKFILLFQGPLAK